MIIEKMKVTSNFTNSENEIIAYILDHRDSFNDITIRELSKKSFSSNATIIRLCQKLGCDGFRDFKIALIKEFESHKYLSHDVDFNSPFISNESTANIIDNLSSLYKNGLNLINSSLKPGDLETVAGYFTSKKRIFIFSSGDSRITATSFINRLVKINYYPISTAEYNEEIAMCNNMNANDVALFITYTGHGYTYARVMKILLAKKCSIAIITANPDSPIAKYSDNKIIIPDVEDYHNIGTFYSQFAFQYIFSIIYSIIYNHDYQDNLAHKAFVDSSRIYPPKNNSR